MYLGVSSQHRGYKGLNKFGKIFISKDVIFHEHSFPFSTMIPISPTISCKSISPFKYLTFPKMIHTQVPSTTHINLMDNVMSLSIVPDNLSLTHTPLIYSRHMHDISLSLACIRLLLETLDTYLSPII